jgi:hypothetical protein
MLQGDPLRYCAVCYFTAAALGNGDNRTGRQTWPLIRPYRLRLIIHIMLQVALPQKEDYASTYEANGISAPKVLFELADEGFRYDLRRNL